MIKHYLLDELDKILALVGVIFSSVLIIWIKLVIDNPVYVMASILCFMICMGYLIIRRNFYPSLICSLDELSSSSRFYITLNILFFLLLSYSIISIYLRPDPYIRPTEYFISTTLMAVIVANEILFSIPHKSHLYFTLCKVIIIGLSLQYSQILIFPNLVGVDTWTHQSFTYKIIDNGYIPDHHSYTKLPMMHLMIGMTSLITDLGYKMATMISISSLQVICDALFVFLLGKFLISTKVGLLAALLLELSNFHIHFGYWTIPNTAAAILILPIVFILFKLRKDKPFIGTLVVIFLMGTLILTHTVTAMCLAILLFAFWAGSETYTRLFHHENCRSLTWTICILFLTGMLAYWTYASGHIMSLANIIKWGLRVDLLAINLQYLSDIPFWEMIFINLGMFLYFSLSFIGFFYMLSKQFRNNNRFIVTIGGIMIICVIFFSLLSGSDIIMGRWIYFSQILLALPLSLSLLLINGIFKNKLIKIFSISISVFALSFLLIMSPVANIDNPFFNPKSKVRSAFTESELHAIETVSEIWNGTMGGDWLIKRPYILQFNRSFVYIDDSLYTRNFTDLQNIMLLVRDEIVKNYFYCSRGYTNLKYDLRMALTNQGFSRIYNCGSISSYLKP